MLLQLQALKYWLEFHRQMAMDTKQLKDALLDRKKELLEWSNTTEDARDTVTLDQQSVGRLSRMDALQQQAMAQATERQRALELHKIDIALKRIAGGDYGFCDSCGEDIAPKRLEIDPAATLCIKCATKK